VQEDEFWVSGSGYLQSWHMRWFAEHLCAAQARVDNISDQYGGIALFGPHARAVLQQLTANDVSNAAFPFMAVRRMDIASAPAVVARLSVSGELGYEIYAPNLHMSTIHDAIERIRTAYDARWVGMYALNSLRLEKSFGIWSREFSRDYTPRMTGLDRFLDYAKSDFIGRAAALEDRDRMPERVLVTLDIDADRADATGYEPIYQGREYVGYVTSGGYGHCVGKSLAMGYVSPGVAAATGELSVTLLGESRPARLVRQASIDPDGARMRG
jgi:dimethylglycine dehydrogenase